MDIDITQQLTVGEVAATSLEAVRVLERNGIDHCFGGKRELGEVCREQGLDFSSLRGELGRAVHEGSQEDTNWKTVPLKDLIRHIVSTHHEYLKLELPRLNERLKKVQAAHNDKDPRTLTELSQVFLDLWEELDGHMHKEEVVLFPCIERLEAAATRGQPLPPLPFGTIGNPIAVMEREHDSAGRALHQMREITSDYRLPEYACATYRALFDGFRELEVELRQHIHLENNILFPRAADLEKTHV